MKQFGDTSFKQIFGQVLRPHSTHCRISAVIDDLAGARRRCLFMKINAQTLIGYPDDMAHIDAILLDSIADIATKR